ncbi:MAG TPA: pyridoxamine 5'-phosphate oxidase family protein [Candidatus Paceibacterota bacterium]|nr:pyridoxamine 5'-phosphate oxidase family protein [Candidatus Paceibacterota bacterium]
MTPEILEYLKGQRVGVFAIEMLDGSPHAATVHFANTDELVFIFETEKGYRKTEALVGREISRASMVVGSNESEMKTLQLDGTAQLLADEKLKMVYLAKFPKKQGKLHDPNAVMFMFTPTWWRFTDWTAPEGKIVVTSDGNKTVTPRAKKS